MRRVTGLIVIVGLLVVIGIAGWWAIDRFSEDETDATPTEEVELVSVAVRRADIIDTETLSGTLRFADPGTITTRLTGTVTAVPEAGSSLSRGDVAFEIDGAPVIVMWGEKPAWRPLAESSADGVDIRQLENNLLLFGFTNDDFTIDEEFTEATTTLIEEWQEDLGLEETGIVELGRVIFIPTEVRIADVLIEVGATVAPGVPVLATSASRQEVQLWLEADRQDLLDVGDSVGLELPDESTTTGVVTDISDVVRTVIEGPETKRVFEVTIRLDDPAAASGLDEAPVDIEIVSEEASDVLVVPVNALLALAEGGYAVEVLQADDTTRFVKVEIGKFADGIASVTGDISEGDRILVPR